MSDPVLKWEFGDSEEVVVAGATKVRSQSHSSQTRRGLIGVLLVILMLMAGTGGFVVGRQQKVEELRREDLQRVVKVEALARSRGDADLMRSILDPRASYQWRMSIEEEVRESRLRERNPTIESVTARADAARVTVLVSIEEQERREVRFYRRLNGQWFRTTAEQAGFLSPGAASSLQPSP